ncbi:MAG: bifunctional 5,10-methylenetetrahydrofolate dehydrogenase/5,10-methenyltetrahydrofolate cyclohydrolase [Candidatus Omnitrophica bacterium]|nr:bifunctional 5,10-methylenetetrahydrofolate dehydrogenase/5,10-methenyltetrahydrofolate cyclohydrolase [Candidatus Omnitrophota bacterium]
MRLLEAGPIARRIKNSLAKEISDFKIRPVLATIQVGDNPGCDSYIKAQKKESSALGIECQLHKLSQVITEKDLSGLIQRLNQDKHVNGIVVMFPLPVHIDHKKISSILSPQKDIEGVSLSNLGSLIVGDALILPTTTAAVMQLLEVTGIDLYGKEVVIVGHSRIVGKPLALMLLEKFATVAVCHIATSEKGNLAKHVERAQVLISAVGRAGLIKGKWIKEGAVVIDVGINRANGKIVGDVEFEEAAKRASWITPVPGGVGPLTVMMLLRNLVEAAKIQRKK